MAHQNTAPNNPKRMVHILQSPISRKDSFFQISFEVQNDRDDYDELVDAAHGFPVLNGRFIFKKSAQKF